MVFLLVTSVSTLIRRKSDWKIRHSINSVGTRDCLLNCFSWIWFVVKWRGWMLCFCFILYNLCLFFLSDFWKYIWFWLCDSSSFSVLVVGEALSRLRLSAYQEGQLCYEIAPLVTCVDFTCLCETNILRCHLCQESHIHMFLSNKFTIRPLFYLKNKWKINERKNKKFNENREVIFKIIYKKRLGYNLGET